MPTRIFISVCEDSADMHAAAVVRMARQLGHDWHFAGLTGPRLRDLGVETVFDMTSHAAMLSGVLGLVTRAWRALRAVEESWRRQRPDVVLLLDSPELNLRLAARARRMGLPVLYYIAPQTWAARAYRNRQIARDVDRLACILPFEPGYFRRHRVHGEFVGHPLTETLRDQRPIPETVEFLRQRAAGRPIVALLPGSRQQVIDAMLPRQLEVIRQLRTGRRPPPSTAAPTAAIDAYAAISCVSEPRRNQIRQILAQHAPDPNRARQEAVLDPNRARKEAVLEPSRASKEAASGPADTGVDIVVADNASLLTAADLVLVASGTAALEVACHRRPMIVMYDAGRLLYWPYRLLGRWFLTTQHLSLVNILAGARVVPEFMPFISDTAPIAEVGRQLLTDQTWRKLMIEQLDAVVRPLEGSEASAKVCRILAELSSMRPGRGQGD